MREATGELNMTMVVVTLVAVLVAFFYGVLWPLAKRSLAYTQNCNNVVCDLNSYDRSKGTVSCQYYDKDGNATGKQVTCPWKG